MPIQRGNTVPVRVYQSGNRIMVAAPLPGVEPEDIVITVEGRQVTIHGEERGIHQDQRDLLMTEWEIGPYHRELTLPEPVDGRTANASYGNGVLVLMLPKAGAAGGESSDRVEIRLEAIEPTVGMRIGHTGQQGAEAGRQRDAA